MSNAGHGTARKGNVGGFSLREAAQLGLDRGRYSGEDSSIARATAGLTHQSEAVPTAAHVGSRRSNTSYLGCWRSK